MQFEKISIDQETFEEINKAVWEAYRDAEESTYKEDMKLALTKVIFEVQKPFNKNDWNCCTITPPEKYQSCDLIIRKKGISKFSDNITYNLEEYRLAFFSSETQKFMRRIGEEAFHRYEDLAEFEYKVIK